MLKAITNKDFLRRLASGEASKCIRRKRDDVYARFDTIEVSATRVRFMYDGMELFYMDMATPVDTKIGDTVTISGLEGEQKLVFS